MSFKIAYRINRGAFGLTIPMINLLSQKLNIKDSEKLHYMANYYYKSSGTRSDKTLINVLEEIGTKGTNLRIKEAPLCFKDSYCIYEENGLETIRLNPELVLNKYKSLNVDKLSNSECRDTLKSILDIIKAT